MGKPSMNSGVLVGCIVVAAALAALALSKYAGSGSSTVVLDNDSSEADRPAGYPATTGAAVRNAEERAARMPLLITPAIVKLGTHSPCDEPAAQTVTITNQSTEMVNIRRLTATCACTSATIEGGRLLEPGQSRTMEVRVEFTGLGGKSQRVDLLDGAKPLASVRVDYEVAPLVVAVPDVTDVGPTVTGEPVRVQATDGRPIKILSLTPDIGTIVTQPDGTQQVIFDLKRADEFAESPAGAEFAGFRRDADGTWYAVTAVMLTDYPTCPHASVLVRRER